MLWDNISPVPYVSNIITPFPPSFEKAKYFLLNSLNYILYAGKLVKIKASLQFQVLQSFKNVTCDFFQCCKPDFYSPNTPFKSHLGKKICYLLDTCF